MNELAMNARSLTVAVRKDSWMSSAVVNMERSVEPAVITQLVQHGALCPAVLADALSFLKPRAAVLTEERLLEPPDHGATGSFASRCFRNSSNSATSLSDSALSAS